MKDKSVGPIFGPDSFQVVKVSVEETGLRIPSFGEMVLIVNNAFQKADSPYYRKLLRLLEEHSFWTDTGVLYAQEGVYIQNNPSCEFVNEYERKVKRVIMEQKELERRLNDSDSNISFLKYGSYNVDYLDASRLKRHKFISVLMRGTPIDELKGIAKRYESKVKDYKKSTYLLALDELPETFEEEPQTRLVSVGAWDNDIGTPSGFHINTMIDESEDDYNIRQTKRMRDTCLLREAYKGRFGIGIE